jgi:hypothetical protein
MSSADNESWARLRLVQGESSAQVWELVASAGQTTLTVGSSPGCHWVVREEGVAPIHFSLHWDGSTLRIADTYGAGDVRVDGGVIGPQWRPLNGRLRIDFGKGAIVVEASAATRSDAPHPLDPKPGSKPPSQQPGAPKGMKATLVGVSPGSAPVSTKTAVEIAPVSAAPQAHASTPPSDSFRPKRPSDSQRSPKPTLVGMNAMTQLSSQPPAPGSSPAPAPSASAPSAAGKPAPGAPVEAAKSSAGTSARGGLPTGTLMGFNVQDVALSGPSGSQRVGGASLADADQRTIQGFPSVGGAQSAPPQAAQIGRRVTQQGVVSEAPGVTPGAVARAPVRTISSQPPGSSAPSSQPPPSRPPSGRPADPHGKVFQEVPAESSPSGVPQAVLTGRPTSSTPPPFAAPVPRTSSSQPPPLRNSGAPRSSVPPAPGRPRERFSDAPSGPHPPAAMEPGPQKTAFPWPYVGIALLTALAYLAWLYLLDHL